MTLLKSYFNFLKFILKPLKFFFSNLFFLFKYDIRQKLITSEDIHYYLDNIKFEIDDDLKKIYRPNIEDPYVTIHKILSQKISVCRFGDGEFELLEGRSIEFQKYSELLKKRLFEILNSDRDDIMICIPYYFWHSVSNFNFSIKNYTRKNVSRKRVGYENLISKNKTYYATEFTQLYMSYNSGIDLSKYFEFIKKIWLNRDITIIQGIGITRNFNFNIFENAKSVSYIYAKSKDAFDDYEELLSKAKTIDKHQLILIILGPTATILAFDLAKMGYQVVDIGHTAKDYDFYKKGIIKSQKNIRKFYQAD